MLVEDNETDRDLIDQELRRAGMIYRLSWVQSREGFIKDLPLFHPDIILCDFSLPQFNALDALQILELVAPDIPLIIVTGTLSDETAVECLKRGAMEYILKEKIVRLPSSIQHVLELKQSKKEREEYQIRLGESERQLRTVTDILPASLIYIDNRFHIRFANKTFENWMGHDKGLVGQSLRDVISSVMFEHMQGSIQTLQIQDSEQSTSFEGPLTIAGDARFVNIMIRPDLQANNKPKGFVCLMTDISERKRYELELKIAKESADIANRSKSQFLANMSHEMRTPLSAMMGFIELLHSSGQSESDRMIWTEKIEKNCERLRVLIDEILDLSKIEAGKLQLEQQTFPITQVIAQLQSILFPLAREKNLELRFKVVGRVLEYIQSDPMKLHHVLVNIIGNAIKFSNQGTVEVTLSMEPAHTDHVLVFTVQDNGEGISREQARNLFQPFTQVDGSMTRRFGGTGLGLALAKKFAMALGGNVILSDSTPGKGSTFKVTIDTGHPAPRSWISSLETMFKPTSSSSEVLIAGNRLDNLKVLLVEDAPDNQFLVRRFLEIAGAKVDVASDGKEGMQKAIHNEYDLVLMDIQMPVLDGYHATSRLRQQGYRKPIVALTAHALKEERERCLRMGFTDFLTKPIKRAELLAQVSRYKSGLASTRSF